MNQDNPQNTPISETPPQTPVPETPSPEAPAAQTTSPASDNIAYPAKKPRSKSTLILLSILAVVIIGAGTAFGIWLAQGGSIGNLIPGGQNSQETNNETETPLTAQTVVDNVRTALNNQLVTAFDDTVITDGTEGPSFKPDGYDFYVADEGVSLTVEIKREATDERAQAIELARQAVDSSLTSEGFELTEGAVADMSDNPLVYESQNIVCVYTDWTTNFIDLSCVDKDDYKPIAEAIKPFVDVYKAAHPNTSMDNVVFWNLKVNDSVNEGYQHADVLTKVIVGNGGGASLFYSVNGVWKHFTDTQSILSCDRYNTEELRLAYEGENCYDEATESMEATVTRS